MNPATLDRLLWRTSKQAPPHKQTVVVSTDTAQLRIRDSGSSKPMVVFLCDPPVTIEAYDEVISLFEPDYRVVVIELPGFGFTKPSSSKACEFSATVISIESAIAQLNPQSLVICGPCIGGFVATELVHRANLDIDGIVLMQVPDTLGMLAWTEGMDPKGRLRTRYIGQMIVRRAANGLTKFWFKFATAKENDHSRLTKITLQALSIGARYPLATMLQKWPKQLKDMNLEIPALVIWGKQDRSHNKTDPRSTLKHVQDAEIIELENCGHFSELEKPEEFHNAVLPFIHSCTRQADA